MMPEYTANYNLIKPGYDETADIKVINENMDTIDGKLKENADGLSTHSSKAASTSASGHVQLQTTVDNSETTALTPKALNTHVAAAAPHSGHETPSGAQAKAEAAAGAVRAQLESHVADNTNPHNVTKSQVGLSKVENMSATEIRTATNRSLKVEVISSSGSVTPEQGRIIFDTSKKKFFGGTGSGWV